MNNWTCSWIVGLLNSPDLDQLPDKPFLGDACMHKGVPWVFMGEWVTVDEAMRRMETA